MNNEKENGFEHISAELENQDLKEIIEIASQITAQLDIENIVKNVVWSFYAKFKSESVTFILPEDIEEDSVRIIHYKGVEKTELDLNIPSIMGLLDFLDKDEYSQIPFSYFKENYPELEVIKKFEKINTDFIVPQRTDKGVTGLVLLPEKVDKQEYNLQEVQYITRMIRFASIAIENSNLYWQATTDRMTKLYSHHYFEKALDDEVNRTLRYGTTFSLIMLDIDHFKKLNDTYGHLQGDIVIKKIAKILLDSVRNIDICSRYGGEEFAVIIPEIDIEGAAVVAERLRKSVEEYPFLREKDRIKVTISVGVTEFNPESMRSPSEVVAAADRALYQSKELGRNRVTVSK